MFFGRAIYMIRARVGLCVQWAGYGQIHHGTIAAYNRQEGTMTLLWNDMSWQAKKVNGGWCAYSGAEGCFDFPIHYDPEAQERVGN